MVTLLLVAVLSIVAGFVVAGLGGLLAQLDWRLGLACLVAVGLLGVGLLILALSFPSSSYSILAVPPIAIGWILSMTALAVAVWRARRKQQRVHLVREYACMHCGNPIPFGSECCPECGYLPPQRRNRRVAHSAAARRTCLYVTTRSG